MKNVGMGMRKDNNENQYLFVQEFRYVTLL